MDAARKDKQQHINNLEKEKEQESMREKLKIKVEAPIYTVVSDVAFAQVDAWFGHTRRDLKMDIIYPEDGAKKYPCVVWICGGA